MSNGPIGTITRGTTAPNRLRRCDRWLLYVECAALRAVRHPVVVDLGYGAYPVTTRELADRLHAHVRPDIDVIGLEIDPERVSAGQAYRGPHLSFLRGGFELAGQRPHVVRAFNVLRQYDESSVRASWQEMYRALAPGGLIIDGTSDEIGRLATWVAIRKTPEQETAQPVTLTLSTQLRTLERPSDLAERLPKILIHRNVPGEPIHGFLTAFDRAWAVAAPHAAFGARQRWIAAIEHLQQTGTPIMDGRARWRLGEVTVPWALVAPRED